MVGFLQCKHVKFFHIGKHNSRFGYKMTVDINFVDHEKDLGLIFQENLK